MSNTLSIALTRLLEYISTINSVCKIFTHMTTMLRVVSLQILKLIYTHLNMPLTLPLPSAHVRHRPDVAHPPALPARLHQRHARPAREGAQPRRQGPGPRARVEAEPVGTGDARPLETAVRGGDGRVRDLLPGRLPGRQNTEGKYK